MVAIFGLSRGKSTCLPVQLVCFFSSPDLSRMFVGKQAFIGVSVSKNAPIATSIESHFATRGNEGQSVNSVGSVSAQCSFHFNPLISNITLQILLSCCHTLLVAETGRIS